MSNNPHPWLIPAQKRGPAELANQDENLVQIASDVAEADSVYSGTGSKQQRSEWGNVFTVFPGQTAQGVLTPAINTPTLDVPQDLTVLLQVAPGVLFSPYYFVAVQITYGVGAAVLTKTVYLKNSNLVRVQLCARNVQVSLQLLKTTVSYMSPPTVGNVPVSVAVVPGHTYLRDGYAWSAGNTIIDAAYGSLWPLFGTAGVAAYPSFGSLGLLTATLTAASSPGSPLYVLLFDSASQAAPLSTNLIIPMGCSPALYEVGDSITFSGIESPESITFTFGLLAALSTTADGYTAPAGGNQFRVDSLIGL